MKAKDMLKTFSVVTIMLSGMLLIPTQAFSWDMGWGRDRDRDRGHHDYPHYRRYPYGSVSVALPHGFISIGLGSDRFFYSSGLFYRHHQDRYIVVPPPSGVVVYAIPDGFNQVIIDGATYYTYNGVYYTRVSQGYQVVQPPPPVVVETATVASPMSASAAQDEFIVNIPNVKGGYSAVKLKRSADGFVGPQGEFYSEFPKVEQLKVMYGK